MIVIRISRCKLYLFMLMIILYLLIPLTTCADKDKKDDKQLLRINLNKAAYYLAPQVDVLEDPTGKLSFNDIKNADYTSNSSASLNFGVTTSVFWLKFRLCTTAVGRQKLSQERVLDIGEAFAGRINWSLYNGHSGLLIASGSSKDSHDSYARIKVTSQPQTFYLRAVSTTSFLMIPRILTWKAYIDHIDYQNIWFGFFYGMMIAVAVYNLFLFFSFNDRSYFWYVLFSIFTLLYFMGINGILGKYILSENSELLGMLNRSFLGFMIAFMALLTKSFLMTHSKAPKTDRMIVVVFVTACILSVINLFSPARIVVTLLILMGILVPLMMVIAAWNSLKTGFKPARLFMIAWALFIVGVVLFAMTSSGVIPFSFFGFNGFQISSGVAAMLLSLALADRIKTLRKERYLFQQSMNRMTMILESMESGVFLIDRESKKIMTVNQSAEKIIGQKREKIIGRQCWEFIGSCRDETCPIMDGYENDDSSEDKLINTIGEEIPVLKRIKQIELDGHSLILESFSDISELKKVEKDLKTAAQARSVFLNNSGQGFLSFGKDLIVEPEYSAECEKIFGISPKGLKVMNLVFTNENMVNKEKIVNFGKNINLIFSEEDEYKKELYLSLLPDEFQLEKKFLKAEYKILTNEKMMLILTDITKNKELEDEIFKERNRLRFVVSTIKETRDFFDILKDYEIFCNETIPTLFSCEKKTEDILVQVYRYVHTFKGLFGQQDFLYIPDFLHKIETRLSDFNKTDSILDKMTLKHQIIDLDYDKTLEKDFAIIEQIIGKEFMDQEGQITISKDYVKLLEDKAKRLLSKKLNPVDYRTRELLHAIRELGFISIKKLLNSHLRGTLELARRQNKHIKQSVVEGDDIKVDPEVYSSFIKSLVHVFRNAVDHGIETPDMRVEGGKEEEASLTCNVKSQKDEGIVITIADDGKGINLEKLRDIAVKKEIFTRDEAIKTSKNKILNLIFLQDFTTLKNVTNISGRGVGLSSVHHELRKLNGNVKIDTKQNQGTCFKFHIPA